MASDKENDIIPFNRALLLIFLSTLLVSGLGTMGWLYYQHVQQLRRQDSSYNIVAIVQTGPEREALKTAYLAELLDLSVTAPQNLYAFDVRSATQKLLSSPLIKEASIQRIRPGTLYIDYIVRQPAAYLADYSNTAIDDEGYIFPFAPFFTPKKIPEIVLGLPPFGTAEPEHGKMAGQWHRPLQGPEIVLALHILRYFAQSRDFQTTQLKRVDVTNAFVDTPGQREIVLVMEDRSEKVVEGRSVLCLYPRILRLSPQHYSEQLSNYLTLREHLAASDLQKVSLTGAEPVVHANPLIVDLRVADIAYLKF